MVFALLKQLRASNAMSEPSSIVNCKNAFHALTDVLVVRLATTVLNADPITSSIPELLYVWKSAVMAKSTLLAVMTVTTPTVMDVVKIVTLK